MGTAVVGPRQARHALAFHTLNRGFRLARDIADNLSEYCIDAILQSRIAVGYVTDITIHS